MVGEGVGHHDARRSLWRVPRRLPGDASRLAGTLEDTPFYARSLAHARIAGEE